MKLLNHHFWASVYVWWWLSAELRPLPVFWCVVVSGRVWAGSGCVSPSKWERTGEFWEWIKLSDLMPFRPEKNADLDVARRKGNVALAKRNSMWEKLVLERELISIWLSASFECWRRGWGGRATPSWPAFCPQTRRLAYASLLNHQLRH